MILENQTYGCMSFMTETYVKNDILNFKLPGMIRLSLSRMYTESI
jgi:hypothetical protein